MICYRLKDKIFFNPYTAFLHAAHNCPHEHVYFDVHESVFDSVDWTVYPTTSYPELYKRRAQQIRNKYEKIVVACSGGTDSTTMLSAFFDNDIHVDAIYIGHYDNNKHGRAEAYSGHAELVVNWIKESWPAQSANTIIKLINLSDFISNRYDSSEWILDQHRTFHMRFTPGAVPEEVSDIFNNMYGAFGWALVTGHEKPQVGADNKSAFYVDKTFSHVMNRANADFFYLSADMPEIVVKQAHDIAKFQKLGLSGYYNAKYAIGITKDIADVNSPAEKALMKKTDQFLSNLNFRTMSKTLQHIPQHKDNCMLSVISNYQHWKDQVVKTWASGIASLQTDSTLVNYMVRHGYLTSADHTMQSYHGIRSKQYHLDVDI
jgi:hypothetical protein